jgi:hypothetical protein
MKKLLVVLMMGLIALVPMASASVRTDGMGIQPVQDADLDTIWTFPQDIEEYSLVDFRFDAEGNMYQAYMDVGGDEWGGIIADMPKIGKLGIYLGRPFNSGTAWEGRDYINAQYGSILTGSISWNNLMNVSWSVDPTYPGWAQPNYEDTSFSFPNWIGGLDYIDQPENKIDLFKTFAVGDGVLGARLNYAANKASWMDNSSQSYTEGDDDGYENNVITERSNKNGCRVIGLDLGYGMEDLGPFAKFDIAAGYSMGSYTKTLYDSYVVHYDTAPSPEPLPPSGGVEGDGINEIRLALRGSQELTEDVDFVTNLNVKFGKLALKYDRLRDWNGDGDYEDNTGSYETEIRTREYKNKSMQLGMNTVHSVNEGTGKVICGLNLVSTKGEWTHTDLYNEDGEATADQVMSDSGETMQISYMGAWINIGVEAALKSWLMVRGGMSKDFLGVSKTKIVTYDDVNDDGNGWDVEMTAEDKWNDLNDVLFTFGIGVEYKNSVVDLLFTESAVENTLKDNDFGEGLLYDGDVLDSDAAKLQVKYLI